MTAVHHRTVSVDGLDVFAVYEAAAAHLPDHAKGIIGPASRERTERIRHYLLAMLGGR